MEIIGVILVIIFALVSANDRKKKADRKTAQAGRVARHRQNVDEAMRNAAAVQKPVNQMSIHEREERLKELRQRKAARAMEAAREPVMPSNAAATFESSLTELRELLDVAQVVPAEGESMLEDADCRGGSMPHVHVEGQSALADEECAGGSMVHAHTQGVSRAAQRRRLADMDHGQEAETEARGALIPDAIDAQALRRAVVMAEVLGKPKALQRSRFVA
ncbi:MAG: hypothetical protein IJ769_07155 [Clostridia bacterium]|nr:hypothetical protein [Clostridia bacterium]